MATDQAKSSLGYAGKGVQGQSRVFTPYDVQTCLHDKARVAHFQAALRRSVKPGNVVVDGGSGTGLLGLLAAKMGAARVYCVEINPEFAEVIEQNAIRNNLQDRIIMVNDDATTVTLPEQVDVIVSEVMSSAFFYEPQLAIIKNLRRYLRLGGVIIPGAVDTQVELLDAQETLYGLNFSYDSRMEVLDDFAMSERKTYLSLNYGGHIPDHIEAYEQLRALHTGTVNAVRFSYQLEFTRGVWVTEPTEFLLNPSIVYLENPIHVKRGEVYELHLSYAGGSSPLACKIEVGAVTPGTAGAKNG